MKELFKYLSKKDLKELDFLESINPTNKKQMESPFEIHTLQKEYIIDPFQDWLQSNKKRGMFLGFRKCGKTDLITIYSISKWIAEDTNRTVIIMTRKQDRYRSIIRAIGQNISSVGINGDFGQDQIRLTNSKQPTVLGLTVNSTTKGWHSDLLIMDDPVEPTDEYSKALKNRVQMVFNESKHISTRVFVIGQYVVEDDIYMFLKKNNIPLLQFWIGNASDELIDLLDLDLDDLRTDLRNYGKNYEGVFYLNEKNPFGLLFTGDYSAYNYDYACVDPSLGGDYTAVSLLKDMGDFYIVKGLVFKKAWFELKEEFRQTFSGVKYIFYENNLTGDQPYYFFKEIGILAQGFRTTRNKTEKILKLQGGIKTNKIRFCETSDEQYISQVKMWSTEGKLNDDAPDSLAMLLENLQLI